MGVPACAEEIDPQKAAEPPVQSCPQIFTDLHGFFNFQFSIAFGDDCHDSVNQASLLTLAAPNYVLLDHDFCRDSAKLMQASLALAAPKILNFQF